MDNTYLVLSLLHSSVVPPYPKLAEPLLKSPLSDCLRSSNLLAIIAYMPSLLPLPGNSPAASAIPTYWIRMAGNLSFFVVL